MIIAQALSPVNWLNRVVTLARAAVTEPEMVKVPPLIRPCLSELAKPGVELPPWVANCAVARKYLSLLGSLDWTHFPERAPNRPWPGPTRPLVPLLWRRRSISGLAGGGRIRTLLVSPMRSARRCYPISSRSIRPELPGGSRSPGIEQIQRYHRSVSAQRLGANERFISREFERHFVGLGVRAGLVGAVAAGLVFFLIPQVMHLLGGEPATTTEMGRLMGSGELDLRGYLLCILVVFVIACLCLITSRLGVIRVLKSYA